jgi:hypothetical protein
MRRGCRWFDVHLDREIYKYVCDERMFWDLWDQVEAMKLGLVDKVCDCED